MRANQIAYFRYKVLNFNLDFCGQTCEVPSFLLNLLSFLRYQSIMKIKNNLLILLNKQVVFITA